MFFTNASFPSRGCYASKPGFLVRKTSPEPNISVMAAAIAAASVEKPVWGRLVGGTVVGGVVVGGAVVGGVVVGVCGVQSST